MSGGRNVGRAIQTAAKGKACRVPPSLDNLDRPVNASIIATAGYGRIPVPLLMHPPHPYGASPSAAWCLGVKLVLLVRRANQCERGQPDLHCATIDCQVLRFALFLAVEVDARRARAAHADYTSIQVS